VLTPAIRNTTSTSISISTVIPVWVWRESSDKRSFPASLKSQLSYPIETTLNPRVRSQRLFTDGWQNGGGLRASHPTA
jgi:hypothetical protein